MSQTANFPTAAILPNGYVWPGLGNMYVAMPEPTVLTASRTMSPIGRPPAVSAGVDLPLQGGIDPVHDDVPGACVRVRDVAVAVIEADGADVVMKCLGRLFAGKFVLADPSLKAPGDRDRGLDDRVSCPGGHRACVRAA